MHLPSGYTIRWRRGDAVAYVFADQHTGCDSDDSLAAIDTIPVPRTGWTDIAEVRLIANRWLRAKGT
ncbi:MAG TPA: hypothetical protein VHH34_00620 [Pseudonocardiaceae bacterium]|nr:hypothetical protein [Pseudonocardiaceae bacterium]